jgi:anti-anti-sigma regulatory factor
MRNSGESSQPVAVLVRPTPRFGLWVTTEVTFVTIQCGERLLYKHHFFGPRADIYSVDLALRTARESDIINVIVDLSRIGRMNEFRLGYFFRLRQKVVTGGGKMALVNVCPRLASIFAVQHFADVFVVFDTLAEATRAFAGNGGECCT